MVRGTPFIALVVALGLSVPALGQYDRLGTEARGGQSQDWFAEQDLDWEIFGQPEQAQAFGRQQARFAQQQARFAQQARPMQLTGRLVGLREIRLQGQRQPHVLAKLRTARGTTYVVDLGTRQRLQNINFRQLRNQQIAVQGVPGRINQNPILVAARLRTPQGQIAQIRQIQPARAQMAAMRQGRMGMQRQPMAAGRDIRVNAMLQGKLVETRQIKLQGVQQPHVLAKIRTDAGQTFVVDLGTQQQVQQLGLKQGQQVMVIGRAGRINQNPILIAGQVATIGNEATVRNFGGAGAEAQPARGR